MEASRMVKSLEELAARLDRDLVEFWGEKVRQDKVVAVVRFSENGPVAREKQLGAAVQAKLHTAFRQRGYNLVEREHLAEILKEVEMQQWGLLDDAKAADTAKMAGADLLILGSVSELGDRFLISARAVSKETATTVAAEDVEIPSATLIAISSEAVVLRTRWDSTYRSMIAVGWGQFYNDEPIKPGSSSVPSFSPWAASSASISAISRSTTTTRASRATPRRISGSGTTSSNSPKTSCWAVTS